MRHVAKRGYDTPVAEPSESDASLRGDPPTPSDITIPSDIFRVWLRWAHIFGVVPLVAGSATFLFWLVTRNELIELLGGVLVVPLGCLCVLCGLISLCVYVVLSQRDPQRPPLKWAVIGAAGLFLADVALGGSAIYGVQAITTKSSVNVVNLSDRPLTSVRLMMAGKAIPLKDIPPGSSVKRSFVANRTGDLFIEGLLGQEKVNGSVGTANNQAMNLTITLDSGGEFHVLSTRVE